MLPAALAQFEKVRPEVAMNLFDMAPGDQIAALESRKIDLGFVGLRPGSRKEKSDPLVWDCVGRHEVVAALRPDDPLAKKRAVNLRDLRSAHFVAMSEARHPGAREWLSTVCQQAGFTPRVLQEVETEADMLKFVAEGLGVTLARAQIKHQPHPGVVFRPLTTPAKAEYWIAHHRDNTSKALSEFAEIVKKSAALT